MDDHCSAQHTLGKIDKMLGGVAVDTSSGTVHAVACALDNLTNLQRQLDAANRNLKELEKAKENSRYSNNYRDVLKAHNLSAGGVTCAINNLKSELAAAQKERDENKRNANMYLSACEALSVSHGELVSTVRRRIKEERGGRELAWKERDEARAELAALKQGGGEWSTSGNLGDGIIRDINMSIVGDAVITAHAKPLVAAHNAAMAGLKAKLTEKGAANTRMNQAMGDAISKATRLNFLTDNWKKKMQADSVERIRLQKERDDTDTYNRVLMKENAELRASGGKWSTSKEYGVCIKVADHEYITMASDEMKQAALIVAEHNASLGVEPEWEYGVVETKIGGSVYSAIKDDNWQPVDAYDLSRHLSGEHHYPLHVLRRPKPVDKVEKPKRETAHVVYKAVPEYIENGWDVDLDKTPHDFGIYMCKRK